jgi:hypothetical protein
MEGDMMRYDFHVHKDFHGIKAEDKEKVYDHLKDTLTITK